jgi:thiol-disulfide isomerase/thioredoxin
VQVYSTHRAPDVHGTRLCLCAKCNTRSCQPWPKYRRLAVPLTPVADPSPERWRGMTNIYFDSIPTLLRDSMQLSPEWRHVEAAEVVSDSGLYSVRALRFSLAASGDTTYLVDIEGTLDFLHAVPLTFERRGNVRVANVPINVRTRRGGSRTVPYQVLVSNDMYTYSRIAEYRSGSVTLDGHEFAIVVRNRGRNHPFYTPDAGTVFWVDQDGDGKMAEQATLTVSGQPAAAEQVMPFRPFLLNGTPLEVTDIDSSGSVLTLKPVRRTAAVSPSFRAPEIVAQRLAGGELRLSAMRGRVVLLQFWATDCAFSERVREAANQLAAKSGASLAWLAMSKERDRGVVEQHLIKHPMNGIIVMADSAAWSVYNPELATPHFVVIDRRGVVRLVATGVTAMDVVTAQVSRLLAEP